MWRFAMQEASGSAKKLWVRLAVCGLLGVLIFAVDTRPGVAAVTVSPHVVKMKAKVGTITYGVVTITNTGASSEVLWTATAPNPPFWPTWGGTCNSLLLSKVVAADQSCTFQFGFHPTQKGRVSGQGTLMFLSGANPTVQLKGIGK
jgi:hypothetical protein